MAGIVTELPGSTDEVTKSGIQIIRRKFNYIREIGDDELIVITPTTGSAVDLKRGFIECPWAGLFSISISNIGPSGNSPVSLGPALVMSMDRGPEDITNDSSEGEIVDLLAGEAQTWPASFPTNFPEQVRCYPVGTQAAGARTVWLAFAAENGKASEWEISLQCKEAA